MKLLVQMAALLAMPKPLALLQAAINSTEGLFVLGERRTKAALQLRHRTSESGGTGSFFRQQNYRAHCSSSTEPKNNAAMDYAIIYAHKSLSYTHPVHLE